jgi:RimJ/RimL family protein N-acetyltransferase
MIVGARVRLRALEPADLDRCMRWINDPETIEHLSIREPISSVSEIQFLQRSSANSDPNSRVFAIETSDGVPIGNTGLHHIHWQDRNAELGILIGEKDYWSKGYGTDAIRTLLRFAFEELNLHRVGLIVDEDNPRAIRCYEKCGFRREGTMRDAVYRGGRYKAQHIMGVLADEFAPEGRT